VAACSASWFNQILLMIPNAYRQACQRPTKTHLTTLPLESRFHPSMSAASASMTPRSALASSASVVRASGVVVGLVVLGLISPGAVAG
jgi:hypothetical protein